MLDNSFNFNHVLARCSFQDQEGNAKTIQGYVMIETSTFSFSVGTLVKNDFQLQGNGKMDMFDGFTPCPTVIDAIVVDGQTAEDGIVHVSYTYTGEAYQIKYRIDDTGDYVFALADLVLSVPGLSLGSHSIEMIPVCVNGYEGTGLAQDFVVTQSLTCGTVISDITITSGPATATAVYAGAATQMKYRIDGGPWQPALIANPVYMGSLSVGGHTVEMVPICANNIEGTGFVKNFTISVQPSQSILNYTFNTSYNAPYHTFFRIYINGVLTVSETGNKTGTLNLPVGSSVKAFMEAVGPDPHVSMTHIEMTVDDVTLTTQLFGETQDQAFGNILQFTFIPNGDDYSITQVAGL